MKYKKKDVLTSSTDITSIAIDDRWTVLGICHVAVTSRLAAASLLSYLLPNGGREGREYTE